MDCVCGAGAFLECPIFRAHCAACGKPPATFIYGAPENYPDYPDVMDHATP